MKYVNKSARYLLSFVVIAIPQIFFIYKYVWSEIDIVFEILLSKQALSAKDAIESAQIMKELFVLEFFAVMIGTALIFLIVTSGWGEKRNK